MNRALPLTLVLLSALTLPATVRAQDSNFVPVPTGDSQAPPGWSFTPTLVVGTGYDDNVLLRGNGDSTPGDVVNVVNPRGALDYNGARGQLSATYDGAVLLYRNFNELNTVDQHGSFYGRRLISRHVALFVRDSAADVPTTELQEFVGVPFVLTGSKLEDLRSGIEASFTKRTSMVVSYDFQWVDFDRTAPGSQSLFGGHSHGATITLKHLVSERLALTGDYDFQHAILSDINQIFDVQNAWAGFEYHVTELTRVFAQAGVSHLDVTQFNESRTGPAWHAGIDRTFRRAGLDLTYSRSYVPIYGFGGTMQNEEVTGRLQLPIGRRVYTTSALSFRRDDPLTAGTLPLRSWWTEGTIGYALSPRLRVEMFYAGTHQTVDVPGGLLDRNRAGIQIIAAKPMRIR
jgi:hypothetical protein